MKRRVYLILLLLTLNIFVGSSFVILRYHYLEAQDLNQVESISKQYTKTTSKNKEINFDELLKKNKDVIGWIYIPDTKIDEPVLKGKDNNTYLRTDINGKHKTSGSIFIDEINSRDFEDENTIIYGHHMHNGTKFTDLEKYMKKDYFNQHSTIYLYTPDHNYTYTVVASGIIRKNSYLYKNTITANNIISSSSINTLKKNTEIDHVIMLSTCVESGSSDRYVVWAIRNNN